MKKIKLLILSCLIITLFIGCTSKRGRLESITFQAYQQMVENKESFVLEVMSSDCTHCQHLKPKLQEVINEYALVVKTINLENLSSDDYQSFTKEIGTRATPTIIFYKDGYEASVSTRIVGDVTKDKIIQKFKDNGIIK